MATPMETDALRDRIVGECLEWLHAKRTRVTQEDIEYIARAADHVMSAVRRLRRPRDTRDDD